MTSKKKLRAKIAVLKYQRKQMLGIIAKLTPPNHVHMGWNKDLRQFNDPIPFEVRRRWWEGTWTPPEQPSEDKTEESLDEAEKLINIDLPKVYSAPVEAPDWQEGMHIGASFFTPRAIMETNADLLLRTDYDWQKLWR